MIITLSPEECEFVQRSFDAFQPLTASHTQVWCKRQYAPMYFECPELARLRTIVKQRLPEYKIAFDVVFQTQGGFVEWHTDHESLGPFLNDDAFRAISEHHFFSIHFNLTDHGGALQTLPYIWPSYVNHLINVHTNIFSIYHRIFATLMRPWAWLLGKQCTNTPRAGNVFNNLRLHSVTAGAPRTSYVLRLMKTDAVKTSKQTIMDSLDRSAESAAFAKFLHDDVPDEPVLAADVFCHRK